jgi:dTMP kinase
MPGGFFAFEGIDGCGKSTQSRLLALELRRRGRKVLHLREPGGTAIGEAVRGLLLDPRRREMTPWTEVFLFMASRAQLVSEKIRPARTAGVTVILDRYYYSTAAYQGAAGGVGVSTVLALAERVARFDKPDRVFVLDIDPDAAARRRRSPADRIERKGLAYQRAVRRSFLSIAKRDRTLRVIQGEGDASAIHRAIVREVDRVL